MTRLSVQFSNDITLVILCSIYIEVEEFFLSGSNYIHSLFVGGQKSTVVPVLTSAYRKPQKCIKTFR